MKNLPLCSRLSNDASSDGEELVVIGVLLVSRSLLTTSNGGSGDGEDSGEGVHCIGLGEFLS